MTNKIIFFFLTDLEVSFEYETPQYHWSAPVLGFDINADQYVAFHTPPVPYPIHRPITVNIVLKQDQRTLEPLKFEYLPRSNLEKIPLLFQSIISLLSVLCRRCQYYGDLAEQTTLTTRILSNLCPMEMDAGEDTGEKSVDISKFNFI